MSTDTSVYTQISDSQERMILFNIYIVCTVGLTISIMILYSLINALREELKNGNTDYYVYAIRCGIVASIGSCLYCLLQLLSNDLILPLNNFIIANVSFVTIIDSFMFISWVLLKICLYFTFTFYYLSIFKKDKIDPYLTILMILVCIAALTYGTLFLADDILHESLKEIGYTQNRNIYILSMIAFHNSTTAMSAIIIAMATDIIYIISLLYLYISSIKDNQVNVQLIGKNYYLNGMRALVLLSVSSIVFIICATIFGVINSDIRYLTNSLNVLVDVSCVFLVFKENEKLYKNLCGCLCDTCCMRLCMGSKYKAVGIKDDDDQDSDEDNDPSFML